MIKKLVIEDDKIIQLKFNLKTSFAAHKFMLCN